MRGSIRRSQRGAVLMVVLVALIAMMISVLALTRSMDTHQLVAGNLAFRNATVHSSDVGVQNAVQWLQGVAGTATLNADAPGQGYYAVLIEQNWDQEGIWNVCGAACTIAADAAGNRVQWMIHRMCSAQGGPNAAGNSCSLLASTSPAATGGSFTSDATNFTGVPQNYYRVTVRVSGPRSTGTLVQTFVSL